LAYGTSVPAPLPSRRRAGETAWTAVRSEIVRWVPIIKKAGVVGQ